MTAHLERGLVVGWDDAAPAERERARAHLAACGECRSAWLAADPSRLFALLADVPLPEERLDELSARIDAELAPRRSRGRFAAVVSIAASLLLAALIGVPLTVRESARPVARGGSKLEIAPLGGAIAGMELVSSPGEARTLDLDLGEARVLMIFDKEIEL